MSTKYSINTLDAEGTSTEVATRSEKEAAIKLADATHAENAGMLTVTVTTEAGTEVHRVDSILEPDEVETEPVDETADVDDDAVAVVSTRTKPWTRTAEARFDAPELEGWTLAYTRTRTKTAIYRANDKSGWLVLDTRDGSRFEFENTKTAREKTNELTAAFNAQSVEARAARKAEKAELAAAKKAAAAEAKTAKEAAKALAKAEKEAAKAAAEAEAPAESELAPSAA